MALAMAQSPTPSFASSWPSSSCALSWIALTIASLLEWTHSSIRRMTIGPPVPSVGRQVGGPLVELQVFPLQVLELVVEVIAGPRHQHHDLAVVLLIHVFEEGLVARQDGLDHPGRLLGCPGPVVDLEDLCQAIGTG